MAAFLKQSTAVTIRLGPFLDATDGVSEETGLTPGIEVSKNHAAFGARSSASAVSHDAEGWYAVPLDTTDTGTLGPLIVKAHDSANHLPVWREFMVVPAHVYDGLVAGTDNLQVDTVQIEGVDATNQINAECDTALTDYDPPTKAELDSGLAALNDPTAAAIADAVWDEAKAGHVGAGSFGEEVQAHALSTEISALNDLSAAQVNAEVDTALADYDPPTKAELDAGLAALNDPTAAAIADAVWDEAKAGHVTAGSFGEEVQAHALSTEISALNDPTAAAIATAVLAEAVEGSLDVTEVLRIILAFAAGKTAGGSTTSITFRDQADTKDRITMTVDGDGDRSAVTVDGT